MRITRSRRALSVVALGAAAAVMIPLVGVSTAHAATSRSVQAKIASFPRSDTVYTSGTMYGPPNIFNPNQLGSYATGTQGLLYETLFLYNPMTNHFINWLAQSGHWVGRSEYRITIRKNIFWSDGKQMTSKDVAFTVMLSKTDPGIYYSNLGADISTVTTAGKYTTVVHFKTPAYEDWQTFLWQDPIVDSAIWSKWSNDTINNGTNTHPVGSGPMKLVTFNNQEVAYQTNPKWWAIKDLGLKLHFKYLVDLVNGSNNVMLGLFLQGNLDLSNNFLPGINSLLTNPIGGYPVQTYYPHAPYMLSANTAWLEPNISKAPMNNVNFRKALAYGISGQQIADVVYGDIVKPSSPTGLLPNLDPYVSHAVIAKYGFRYDKKLARQYLAKSHYHGQTLTLEVPDGWTDWMAAIQNISQQCKAIGINVKPEFPSYTARTSDLTNATYDLAIDNNQGASSDPFAYFTRVYRLPLNSTTAAAQDNWERFKSAAAWSDVLKLNSTPISADAARSRLFGDLETNFLKNVPEIPLWYNGAWAQYYTGQWKDWPTSTNKHDNYEPVMWRGYLGNMTTILGLANLRPV